MAGRATSNRPQDAHRESRDSSASPPPAPAAELSTGPLPEAPLRHLLLDFFTRHWPRYLLAIAFLIGVAGLNLLLPWAIGATIDALRDGSLDHEALLSRLLWLVGAGLALYALRYAWRVTLFGTAYQLGTEQRDAFHAKLTRLDPGFYQRHRTGDLMAHASQDIDAVEMAAAEGVLSSVDGAMTFVLVLGIMLIAIDVPLTLLALLPFPFMAWAFARISRRIGERFRESLERFSDLNDQTQEAFAGIRMLRSHALLEDEGARFSQRAAAAEAVDYRVQKLEAAFDPVVFIALSAATLLTLGVGSWRYLDDAITLGQLTSFTLYLAQLIWPMFALGWCLNILQRGAAAARRLATFHAAPQALEDSGTLDEVSDHSLRLEINEFSYSGSQQRALGPLSLQVAAGGSLGIVGATGSGKSTLLRLLSRSWPLTPEQGVLTLGGREASEYTLSTWRQQFSLVPQDPFLFALSVADNVALACPEASDERIREALRAAAFEEDLRRLPQGLETLVGERGITLSGGQRQRLALARSLLSEAPILLLDDTLSAVDQVTERTLLKTLARLQQPDHHGLKRKLIINSHRLSAVQACQQILVLEDGRILEQGDHASLLAARGAYWRLWQAQQVNREDDAKAERS